MADPITAGAVPGATSLFSGIFQSFKDPRSPYLLTGVLCVACLSYIIQLPNASDSFFLIFLPIAGIFTFLCVLCFYVKAYKAPHDEAQEKSDLEDQFKFSRAFCLAAGVFSIAYLFASVIDPPDPDGPSILQKALGLAQAEFQVPSEKGFLFWIMYDLCLVHISIFVVYIMLRSFQEDSLINMPLFQITLFTAAILVGLVVTTAGIRDQDKWLYSCKNSIFVEIDGFKRYSKPFFSCEKSFVEQKIERFKKKEEAFSSGQLLTEMIVSPAKITYWYLLLHLIAFEGFWLYRLVRVVRFKFDFVIIDEPEARK